MIDHQKKFKANSASTPSGSGCTCGGSEIFNSGSKMLKCEKNPSFGDFPNVGSAYCAVPGYGCSPTITLKKTNITKT